MVIRTFTRVGAAAIALGIASVAGTGAAAFAAPSDATSPVGPATAGAVPAGWAVTRTTHGFDITRLPLQRMPITDARPHVVTAAADLGPARTRPDGSVTVTVDRLPGDLGTLTVRYGATPEATLLRTLAANHEQPYAVAPGTTTSLAPGVVSTTYSAGALRVPGMKQPLGLSGQVVAPTSGSALPVVLFLHGRHDWCTDGSMGWPCRHSTKPVDNMAGYRYAQEALARRGYFTVSIDANAVDAQDGDLVDGGAAARSALVRAHLALLAGWRGGGSAPFSGRVASRYDAGDVMLVGHSRGGEGAAYAAIEQEPAKGYRINGLVLLGPTNFSYTSASATPTLSVVPGCDGDVSDLEGVRYSDSATWFGAEHALSSLAYLPGANHNYFNTSWTPGAPTGVDDGEGSSCAPRRRLTPARQRQAGVALVTDAADRFLRGRGRPDALDGTGAVPADQRWMGLVTSGTGGARHRLADPISGWRITGATTCTGTRCVPVGDADVPPGVHWAGPAEENPAGWRWDLRRSPALEVRPPRPVSLVGKSFVDVRAALSPDAATEPVLTVTDAAGRRAVLPLLGARRRNGVSGDRDGLGGRWIAQNLRFSLAAARLDLGHVTSMTLGRGAGAHGTAIVLDMASATNGTTPATSLRPSLLRAPATVRVAEGSRPWVYRLSAALSAPAARPMTTLALVRGPIATTASTLPVAAGARTVSVPVKVLGNTTWNPDMPTAVGLRVRGPVLVATASTSVVVADDDPLPAATAQPTATARPGGVLRWTITLDRPSGGFAGVYATPAATSPALTTGEMTPDGRTRWNVVDEKDVPLADAGARYYDSFDIGARTLTIRLPLAAKARAGHKVAVDIEMEGASRPRTTRLVGTVVK